MSGHSAEQPLQQGAGSGAFHSHAHDVHQANAGSQILVYLDEIYFSSILFDSYTKIVLFFYFSGFRIWSDAIGFSCTVVSL